MIFPQYLWRIAINGIPIIIRRGNDCNEPIEKSLRKDAWEYWDPEKLGPLIIGIFDSCSTEDSKQYSTNHPWDWLNVR